MKVETGGQRAPPSCHATKGNHDVNLHLTPDAELALPALARKAGAHIPRGFST